MLRLIFLITLLLPTSLQHRDWIWIRVLEYKQNSSSRPYWFLHSSYTELWLCHFFLQNTRCRLLPDKSLYVLGRNEILFRRRQSIRQIGERPNQKSSAPGCCADSDQTWRSPDLFGTPYGDRREVMWPDKQRIVVKDLRTWRFIVCIVQANKRVP